MATKVTMLAIVLSAVSVSCSLFHGPITEEKQCLPVGSGPCDLVKNLCCEGSRCNPLVHECLGTEDASQPAEETAARLEDPPAVDPEKETWPDPDRDAPPDGYVAMPSGFFHPECVHQWDQNVEMTDTADGTLVQYPNGSTVVLPPCPHAPFRRNSRPTAHEDAKDSPKSPVYYSGWIAYAGYTQPKEYSFMTSTWTVPPPPVKHLFINTIFFFQRHGGGAAQQHGYHPASTTVREERVWWREVLVVRRVLGLRFRPGSLWPPVQNKPW